MSWERLPETEGKERREELALEILALLILAAAVVGACVGIFAFFGRGNLSTGLSLVVSLTILVGGVSRSDKRAMRHERELEHAYQQGRLHMHRQLNGEEV